MAIAITPMKQPLIQNNLGSKFVGPEGGSVGWKIGGNQQSVTPLSTDPRDMNEDDLMKQISIARQADVTRGLTPQEKDDLFQLENTLQSKQGISGGIGQSQIDKYFDQSPAGTPSDTSVTAPSNQFSIADYIASAQDSAQKQRDALGQSYDATIKSGTQDIADAYNPIRRRQLEENAVMGNLREPAGRVGVTNIDTQRGKSISDYINSISGQKAQNLANVESGLGQAIARAREFGATTGINQDQFGQTLANRKGEFGFTSNLERAKMAQQGQQFGQDLGLRKQQFVETGRRNSLEDLRRQQEIDASREAGRLQAQGEDDGILGKITKVATGLGGLATGGGAIAQGIGTSLNAYNTYQQNKPKKSPGVK